MTTTQLETALSLYNPVLGETKLYNTRNAFITKNNRQLVHHATQALTEIQKYQLVSLLDICSYARGMKSKFELAIENAEEIIHYAPEWSIGYLRLGHLLDMQGKSAKSIEVYRDALEIISQQDDPVAYHQLIQLKKAAVERNETRINFIVMLPPELTSNILLQLSEEDKSTFFYVSTVWRKWMMENGSIVWKELLNSNTERFKFQSLQTAIKIANTLPYIVQHVKTLTLNAQRKDIWERYMEFMGNGKFKVLKSFTITAVSSRHIRGLNKTMVLLNALWQVKLTLTTLDIRANTKANLADLLFYCPNLRKLVYHSFYNFDTYLGDMELLGEPRHKLVHVEFESQRFRRGSLVKFLKIFPNIRRLLLLKGCIPENLNEVMEYCHNLESFGYNCAGHKMNRKELDYHQDSYYNRPSSAGGITEIFTSETGYGVPTTSFLQLLQKNAKSLKRLHANMSMTSEQEEAGEPFLHVTSVYPSWQFTQLEHLTYHSDIYRATEKLFLQSIEFCTSLKKLDIVDIVNLRMLVDTLIQLPPLEELNLSNITNIGEGDQILIKLFKVYADNNHILPATVTRTPLISSRQQRKKFNYFACNYCNFITDDVLEALSELETIKTLRFSGTCTIPSNTSLQNCLNKMSRQLVKISLIDIIYVDDNVLGILSNMDQLKTVYLEKLSNISAIGIIHLVDNTKSIRDISILSCKIPQKTLIYVKKKVKFLRV